MQNCPFCRIAAGDVPATIVHQDDEVVVFRDIRPQAPLHLLVIPRRHIVSLAEAAEGDHELLGRLLLAAAAAAKAAGADADGYRVVTNIGRRAGQSVFHLHFHVLAGRRFSWPPG